jgi:hypothetical protein
MHVKPIELMKNTTTVEEPSPSAIAAGVPKSNALRNAEARRAELLEKLAALGAEMQVALAARPDSNRAVLELSSRREELQAEVVELRRNSATLRAEHGNRVSRALASTMADDAKTILRSIVEFRRASLRLNEALSVIAIAGGAHEALTLPVAALGQIEFLASRYLKES